MRGLLLAVAVIFTASVHAKVDRDVIQAAQWQFNKMSAAEAYASNAFVKQVPNHWMPGTSTWLNPVTGLCIRGGNLETVKPIVTCTAYTGKDKRGDIKTVYTYGDAKQYLKSFECSATASRMASAPLDYKYVGCVLWSARKNGDVKVFKTRFAAEQYGHTATCVQEAEISAPLSTTYAVNFFVREIDNRNLLGSHTYAIRACGGDVGVVPAN